MAAGAEDLKEGHETSRPAAAIKRRIMNPSSLYGKKKMKMVQNSWTVYMS